MATSEQIKLLIELQKLDSKIFKLKRELADHPVLINNLEEQFKQKETMLKSKEEELKSLMLQRKQKEMELQAKEDAVKKLNVQLYSIKTNKEYQAMEREIASQKADISVFEEEIIRILDKMDECTRGVNEQKGILNQESKHFEEEKAKIAAKAKEEEQALQQLTVQRADLAQKADKEFLAKYERILHSKNGLAMVSVIGNACGGCNINLPPQVINEIKMEEELIFCGSCARILYIDENESQ